MIEVEINKGQNIIDIYFDDFASCLVVKKALAVNWYDCRGSIGEYYSISDFSTEERDFYTNTINNILSEGNDFEQFEIIKEFLNLFSNGKYSINKYTANISDLDFLQSDSITYSKDTPENERFSGWFYPDWNSEFEAKIFSITNDKIDPNRVEYYCQLIKNGIRPTILTFEVHNQISGNYSRGYVLDGHHKIEAYLRLKENIPIINIIKVEECKGKTNALLHYVKPILKDFEYQHLFKNNDENLLEIDFVNDEELTSDLDYILKNLNKIDFGIMNVLKKYSNSTNNTELKWLDTRLNTLKKNKNINIFGFGKGLKVLKAKPDEQYGQVWFSKKVNNYCQLNNWIKNTIKTK